MFRRLTEARIRPFYLFILVYAYRPLVAGVQTLPSLPNGVFASAIQVDASGNIYVAGSMTKQASNDTADAFAARLSPDGSQVVWWTTLAGSNEDRALAMALGPDGSVYLTGNTASADFPTTPGSMQPAKGYSGTQAFAAKLDPKGAVLYATYIGGPAASQGRAITADAAGHAFITGLTGLAGFPTTAGAVAGDTSLNTGFVLELNAAGSAAVVAIRGFGGYQIAADAQGNIYAAGAFAGPLAPTTPGAFQRSSGKSTCLSTPILTGSCQYQHIAKIDPTGTQLIYATYIAGEWGAVPSGIAVDGNGNVIVAGSANGADYPITPGAYQSLYLPDPQGAFLPPRSSQGPVSTGYVTKLNADGISIIWSTYFGGSGSVLGSEPVGDVISSMAIDADGNVLVGGLARSSDLPGLWTTPMASRPSSNGMGFVARFSSDGVRISATQLVANQVSGIAVRSDGTAVVVLNVLAGGPAIVSFPANGRVYAIADPADNARVVTVAPGQLLTLYGAGLAPSAAAQPSNGFPTSFNGVTVTFNGIPAPILYTSGIQINLQVPYEIAGQNELTMRVSSQLVAMPVSESYILGVVARQPSVFLSAVNFSGPIFGELACKGTVYPGVQALAVNPDGSVNSCANPAPPGSVVNLFLNGMGVTNPAMSTGAISPPLQIAITPTVGVNVPGPTRPASAISTVAAPSSISGLAESVIQISSSGPAVSIPLDVAGVRTREQNMVIWVKSTN